MLKAISVAALLACCISACSAGNQSSGGDAKQDPTSDPASHSDVGRTLVLKGKTFSGPQDLSQFLKPSGKGQPPPSLEFQDCTFQGKVTFSPAPMSTAAFSANLSFVNCGFEEEVNASQVQFMGSLLMKNCRFKKMATFQNTTFLAPVAMRQCSFDGDAAFQNAVFLREANFMDSHFFTYTLFQQARFMGGALFGNAMYHQNADFTLVRFMEGAQFDYGKFTGRADFTGCRIEGPFSLRQVQAAQVILKQIVALAPVNLMLMTVKDSTLADGAFYLLGQPKK